MMLRYWWFIVVVLTALFAGSISGEKSAGADGSYDSEELEFLKTINEYRHDNGLPALILSDALADASERHSEDMGRYHFFDHNTAKSSHFPAGSRPWDRMALSGYDYNASMSENLAAGHDTAQEAFEAWRNSPGHDANMLDGNQRVIGIARLNVPNSKYGWYWTTDFGSEVDPTAHAAGETPPSGQKASEKEQEPEKEQASEKERDRNTDSSEVENGLMEGTAVWEQKSTREGRNLLVRDMARLGGYDDAEDEISQEIQVRNGQELTYRVRVATREREHPADGLVVRLTDEDGEHLVTLKSHTDADARKDGWTHASVDLSRFAGETVKLSFLAKTDGERPTAFYVDDVALE